MLSGGTLTGDLTVPTVHGALDGNADSATRLQTARRIGGVSFDGTADIDLPGVNKIGNQDTTGTADSANYIVYTKGISGDKDNNIALEALQLNRMTLTRAQGVNISGSQRFGSIISRVIWCNRFSRKTTTGACGFEQTIILVINNSLRGLQLPF